MNGIGISESKMLSTNDGSNLINKMRLNTKRSFLSVPSSNIFVRWTINSDREVQIGYEWSDYPSANLDTAQHWPGIAKNLLKINCQYRAVAGVVTPVCTWRPILAQTLDTSTCFRHSNGPMLCRTGFLTSRMVCRGKSDIRPSNLLSMGRTRALLLSELDAIVNMTIGLV